MTLLRSLRSRRNFGHSVVSTAIASIVAPTLVGRAARAQEQRQHERGRVPHPTDAMSDFLNGFHFYADDMGRQVEANHFCMHLSDDFHQCVIFDTNRPDAKLIGIEYIVTERVFRALPEEEKRFWHSHNYEVKSGLLVAPEMPANEEHAFMRDLVTTYGKTWHTWQIDRDPGFPRGIPQLMMGFVKDGEIDPRLVQARDERFHIASGELRRERSDIPMTDPAAGANSWQSGRAVQLTVGERPLRPPVLTTR